MVIRQDRGRDLPRFGPSAEVKTYSCLSDLLLMGWLTTISGDKRKVDDGYELRW